MFPTVDFKFLIVSEDYERMAGVAAGLNFFFESMACYLLFESLNLRESPLTINL
ncbi:hypothetical protein D1AOALGA4SA_12256 [Olavius algarvensis Delta 1 endosymbiont]|nr:hypothetical protein D1AOALGA4SA_12256 [Olavius algarvensis Delta 1 endosymbiont]